MTKRNFVLCSCGRRFMKPQTLWDHYVREYENVAKDVRLFDKRPHKDCCPTCGRQKLKEMPW
jgi:hypothetical protein